LTGRGDNSAKADRGFKSRLPLHPPSHVWLVVLRRDVRGSRLPLHQIRLQLDHASVANL